LSLKGTKGTYKQTVPSEVKSLRFWFWYIQDIDGLKQLKNLESIVFNFIGDESDFSFLSGVPLKRLVIENASIANLTFISKVPSLEVIVISRCSIKDTRPIDLSINKKLKLVSLENCWNLKRIPFLGRFPESLEYFWIQYNKIETLDQVVVQQLGNLSSVSFAHNPVAKKLEKLGFGAEIGDYHSTDDLPPDLKLVFHEREHPEYSLEGKYAP